MVTNSNVFLRTVVGVVNTTLIKGSCKTIVVGKKGRLGVDVRLDVVDEPRVRGSECCRGGYELMM